MSYTTETKTKLPVIEVLMTGPAARREGCARRGPDLAGLPAGDRHRRDNGRLPRGLHGCKSLDHMEPVRREIAGLAVDTLRLSWSGYLRYRGATSPDDLCLVRRG